MLFISLKFFFSKQKSLILLVHHMGGSVRQVANRRTTFVIAKLCEGNEYRYAATFGVSVVSESWVFDAWQNRNIVGFKATDLNFVSVVGKFLYFF